MRANRNGTVLRVVYPPNIATLGKAAEEPLKCGAKTERLLQQLFIRNTRDNVYGIKMKTPDRCESIRARQSASPPS
jgi:hypothetical protein